MLWWDETRKKFSSVLSLLLSLFIVITVHAGQIGESGSNEQIIYEHHEPEPLFFDLNMSIDPIIC